MELSDVSEPKPQLSAFYPVLQESNCQFLRFRYFCDELFRNETYEDLFASPDEDRFEPEML
jgi:hypothetical protein